MRAPRIALVLGPSTGGIGQHVRSLAVRLVESGHTVRIAGPAATDRRFGFGRVGQFVPLDVPAPGSVRRGRAVLAGADVIHAHGHAASVVAALARHRSTSLVVSWHNTVTATGWRGLPLHLARRWVVRRATVVLAASADLAEDAASLGARDARLLPVSAPTLAPASRSREEVRRSLGLASRPLVLAVGRLAPQKRYDVLLDAVARLVDRDALPPLVLVAGEGPLDAELAERIERERLPVRLAGHRTDVADLLTAADVAVLTSQWEARALVAQEALRSGVPLVATAVGGIPDLVGSAALLVPPGDPGAVAAALAEVLDRPEVAGRLRAAGPRQAATWPDEDETARQIAKIYHEVITPG
ncbi:glycosyltransferase family 4 protein [Actinopolymorpha sp. NPDC004070]|uniref:glycosyltransferase family 4 protein n=1 Tax=Actinopolymorpha sp. NPDC004070 TaxID=3154548 RepID=UPI0033B11C1B